MSVPTFQSAEFGGHNPSSEVAPLDSVRLGVLAIAGANADQSLPPMYASPDVTNVIPV